MPESLLSAPATGYSPKLRMTVRVAGHEFDVSSQSPNYIRLRNAVSIDPGRGTLVTDVADDVRYVEIELPMGIDPERGKQPIVR